jgi:hypothetical protein
MRQPDSNSDARDFDDCAESHRVARAHTLPLEGEPRAVAAPTVAAQFFEEHAISLKVAEARPYLSYEKGDPERLVRQHWSMSPRFAARIARQDSGIIIPRYAPPGMGLNACA